MIFVPLSTTVLPAILLDAGTARRPPHWSPTLEFVIVSNECRAVAERSPTETLFVSLLMYV